MNHRDARTSASERKGEELTCLLSPARCWAGASAPCTAGWYPKTRQARAELNPGSWWHIFDTGRCL